MINGIVFDMDSLMLDTERLAIEGYTLAGRKMGIDISESLIKKTLGLNKESTRKFYEENAAGFNYDEAHNIMVDYTTDYIEKNGVPLKPGLIELLDYLKDNNYKLTVATSTGKSRAEYYFNKAGISKYFKNIVCGDMITRGKPEPDIYLKACEAINTPPEECIALEDSLMGILSAHSAGTLPVMIPDLIQPDSNIERLLYAKLQNLSEVIALLEEHGKSDFRFADPV